MMDFTEIEIPIGISRDNKVVSIPVRFKSRNHCFITGCAGSGKSTLLNNIINAVTTSNRCNHLVVMISSMREQHTFIKDSTKDCEELLSNLPPKEHFCAIIDYLHKEAKQRLSLLSSGRNSSYRLKQSFPHFIALIDDLDPCCIPDNYNDRSDKMKKLSDILRMSHAIGLSVICSSQIPISTLHGLPVDVIQLYNIRIALRAPSDIVIEALGLYSPHLSYEEKLMIEDLAKGRAGDFIYLNRYDTLLPVLGHVN